VAAVAGEAASAAVPADSVAVVVLEDSAAASVAAVAPEAVGKFPGIESDMR